MPMNDPEMAVLSKYLKSREIKIAPGGEEVLVKKIRSKYATYIALYHINSKGRQDIIMTFKRELDCLNFVEDSILDKVFTCKK